MFVVVLIVFWCI